MKNRPFGWLIASIFVAVFIGLLTGTSTDNRSAREQYLDAQEEILTLEATASRQYQIGDAVGFQYSKDSLRLLTELSREAQDQHNEQLLRELWCALSGTGNFPMFKSVYDERRL